jgi:hypothetical protein
MENRSFDRTLGALRAKMQPLANSQSQLIARTGDDFPDVDTPLLYSAAAGP